MGAEIIHGEELVVDVEDRDHPISTRKRTAFTEWDIRFFCNEHFFWHNKPYQFSLSSSANRVAGSSVQFLRVDDKGHRDVPQGIRWRTWFPSHDALGTS